MVDLTRKKDFAEKKSRSVAAARVTHDMVGDTTLHELFNLPPNAIITDAMVNVEVVGQATLTVDFGFDGGAELGNDLDVNGSTGVVYTAPSVTNDGAGTDPVDNLIRIPTGTGKTVTAKFSADPTAGSWVFIVEFIEYDLSTGELMNYSA